MLRPTTKKGPRRQPPASQSKSFLAPTGGWLTAVNNAAAPVGSAKVMDNFLPTATGMRPRGGSKTYATASGAGEPLESAMSYVGLTSKLFVAANGKIIDVTSVANEDIEPAAAVTGQTSDYYSYVTMQNSGGYFMVLANGTDPYLVFDGSTFTPIASGAGAGQLNGVASDKISQVNTYRSHLWLVEDGTLNAWWLPTDQYAGTASKVPLTGISRLGGKLLFIATWSYDAGDGIDDRLVFVTDQGECIVFQGDPAIPETWGLIGRFDSAPPLGKRAFLSVGGDLLILTEIGAITMSAIANKDPAALAMSAVSRNIQPDWITEARMRRGLPWEIVKWPSRNLAFVTCPMTGEENVTPPICFTVNLETGAWARITGWDTRCFVLHGGLVYFGTSGGKLVQAEVTGSDNGQLIFYTYVGHPDHLGMVGQYKTVDQVRATFLTRGEFRPLITVTTDYAVKLPAYPSAVDQPSNSLWDQGVWDLARWDAGLAVYEAQTRWVSVGQSGYAHAPVILMTSGSPAPLTCELVTFDAVFTPGGLVV